MLTSLKSILKHSWLDGQARQANSSPQMIILLGARPLDPWRSCEMLLVDVMFLDK